MTQPQPKKFKTSDRELSKSKRNELDKLKVRDLREAVIESRPELRSFLDAEQR